MLNSQKIRHDLLTLYIYTGLRVPTQKSTDIGALEKGKNSKAYRVVIATTGLVLYRVGRTTPYHARMCANFGESVIDTRVLWRKSIIVFTSWVLLLCLALYVLIVLF